MANPIEWILKKIVQGKVEKQMGNIMNKLNGSKTYITLVLGMVVVVVGHFWGPINVGPINIPAVDSKTMFETLWAGIAAMFMRHGITKSGPTPPAT